MCGPGDRAPIARARPSAVTKARLDRNERAMSDTQKWLAVAAIAAAVLLLYLLRPKLTPFLVAAGLAYLSDPWADRLEAKGLSRTSATVLVNTQKQAKNV